MRSRSLVYIGVARGDISDDGYAGAECIVNTDLDDFEKNCATLMGILGAL